VQRKASQEIQKQPSGESDGADRPTIAPANPNQAEVSIQQGGIQLSMLGAASIKDNPFPKFAKAKPKPGFLQPNSMMAHYPTHRFGAQQQRAPPSVLPAEQYLQSAESANAILPGQRVQQRSPSPAGSLRTSKEERHDVFFVDRCACGRAGRAVCCSLR
jgi:hypothetical protein